MSNKKMNSPTNYFIGYPANDYSTLLEGMSSTSVNSNKTSSLPLAEFWHPRNPDKQESILRVIGITDYDSAAKVFEHLTPAYQKGTSGKKIQYSGPSTTDLMIIGQKHKIAIEAKYTEYKQSYESIDKWKQNHSKNNNLDKILECWKRYIGLEKHDELNDDIPYQFLHRSASACFEAGDKERVLLYQLFFDEKTKEHLEKFESNLSKWAKELSLDKKGVRFIIAEVEIDENNSPALKSKLKNELFKKMIDKPQYFFNSVVCKDGYTLEKL